MPRPMVLEELTFSGRQRSRTAHSGETTNGCSFNTPTRCIHCSRRIMPDPVSGVDLTRGRRLTYRSRRSPIEAFKQVKLLGAEWPKGWTHSLNFLKVSDPHRS